MLDHVYRAVTWQHVDQIQYIAPSLMMLIPNSLSMHRLFYLSEVSARVDVTFLPVARFLRGDYSPTATNSPSLRLLIQSGSLTSFQPVQVYYNHPRHRVPLDPVYYIIYPCDYLVWAFPRGLKLGRFPFRAG
jgi:hypothetical protein